MRKILVTGGAGYLGSTLVHDLVRAGDHVRVLDSLVHGCQSLLPLLGHERFELFAKRKGDFDLV